MGFVSIHPIRLCWPSDGTWSNYSGVCQAMRHPEKCSVPTVWPASCYEHSMERRPSRTRLCFLFCSTTPTSLKVTHTIKWMTENSWLSPVHLVVLLLQFQLFCLWLWNPDLFTGCATLSWTCCFDPPSLSLIYIHIHTHTCSLNLWMLDDESQLTFTPEVLTCCTLYNHWLLFDPAGHRWTFEHLEERSGLALFIISTWHSHMMTGHPSQPGSSLDFFLGSCLFWGVFTSHCASTSALLAVWGFWLSFCKHFVTSADV
jgi:hypothetical protein